MFRTDPLDFDQKCDGSLPLEELLQPNPELRKLLQDIDRSKTRVWGLTNAYHTVRTFDLRNQFLLLILSDLARITSTAYSRNTRPDRRHRFL